MKIPQSDSIEELAKFWDQHDLTDFDAELEEVPRTVFERETEVKIHLPLKEVETIQNLAASKGIGSADLIREWVLARIESSS